MISRYFNDKSHKNKLRNYFAVGQMSFRVDAHWPEKYSQEI